MRQPGRPAAAPGELLVVGLGYVGLPLVIAAVEAGFRVTGVDVDEERIKRLVSGDSYVEDVSGARLLAALDSGRLQAATRAAEATPFDVCVLTVPTPLQAGAPDLSCVESAVRSVAPLLRRGALVVLESTTYPGTTDGLVRALLEEGSGLRAGGDFGLGYSPERIDPGNAQWRLENTPKVVSGIDDGSLDAAAEFYGHFVERTVRVSSTRTAELTKLLENTFRHVNIALVNELAMCAPAMGADIWEAISAAATKPFGYMPFRPGPGVGGHCLPVDPAYLSWQVRRVLDRPVGAIAVADVVNRRMPRYVVERLAAGLERRGVAMARARVLVVGLAYKKGTGDLRESPALAVLGELVRRGVRARVADPYVDVRALPSEVTCVPLTEEEVTDVDGVLVLTDHDECDYSLIERCAHYVFDARNRCQGARVERL